MESFEERKKVAIPHASSVDMPGYCLLQQFWNLKYNSSTILFSCELEETNLTEKFWEQLRTVLTQRKLFVLIVLGLVCLGVFCNRIFARGHCKCIENERKKLACETFFSGDMTTVIWVKFLQEKVAHICGLNKILTSPILAKQDYEFYSQGSCTPVLWLWIISSCST